MHPDDNIRYIHLFGHDLHGLLLWGSSLPGKDKLLKQMDDSKTRHSGGITFRVNHTRQNIVTALCSFKDPYSRRKGRIITDYRAAILEPVPFEVLVPQVNWSRNSIFFLQQLAVSHSLNLWIRYGWPVDQFCVNFVVGVGHGEEERKG